MSKILSVEVRAANTDTAVRDHQCDIVQDFESIKEAKAAIKRYLSPEYFQYMKSNYDSPEEAAHCQPIRYAQVWVIEGNYRETEAAYCHSDFFSKGYNGESRVEIE